ncbi:hypothetical protein L7F22_036571 [Adiantum nelumboides]|nr:hypothetical protein [Adiantum nelumboides]
MAAKRVTKGIEEIKEEQKQQYKNKEMDMDALHVDTEAALSYHFARSLRRRIAKRAQRKARRSVYRAFIWSRTPSPGEMARNSCSSSKISIWWDIENCHVPRNVDPHYIAQNLRFALLHANMTGPITIDVFGDTRSLEHRILEALSSTGITINHIPSGNKDAADKAILVGMLFWALDNPPPAHFLLISGDGDFANALHRLRLKGYDILLARPDQPVKPALLGAATSVWYWTNVAKGHIALSEELNSSYEDSAGTKARASRVLTDEDAQNMHYRVTASQQTDLGELSSFKVSRTQDVRSKANTFSVGERRSEREQLPTFSTPSRMSEHHMNRNVIQENVKVNGGTTQSLAALHAQRERLGSQSLTSTSLNTSKQLFQSAPVETYVSRQSNDGHLSSNKITEFTSKGPPEIVLSEPSMIGNLQGLSQDAQTAYNMNLSKVMKTFEKLKTDGLVPTLDNLCNCLCYWDKQNKKVNFKQVLDQALNLGHVEKVSGGMGGGTIFLPTKTVLWRCFDVHDMQYAFSETLSKDFHQFLCCSKNWQFFLHSQSMYEAAQRLKKDGPGEIRHLAVGEIIHFLNQAIWKRKWLGLESTPTFLLSIKSQAVLARSPNQRVPLMPSQPERVVLPNVVSRHTTDRLFDTSRILERLREWLKETANSRQNYDVSLVPKDFHSATGIKLNITDLGFSRLQDLLEHFSDVVKIQEVRKGLKVLCPAVAIEHAKQQKGILSTSEDKQQKGLLVSPQEKDLKQPVVPVGYVLERQGSTQAKEPVGSAVYVQERQGSTLAKEALTSHRPVSSPNVTFQHVRASHVVARHAASERPVTKTHPVMKMLRNWLLQLLSIKQGYDLSLVKKDFYQATGTALDSASLSGFKVKDIVSIFPEDFRVESPRPGLSLLFSNNEIMPARKLNAGSKRQDTGKGENLDQLVNDVTSSKLPQASVKIVVDGKALRVADSTKEAVSSSIALPHLVYTDCLPLNAGQLSSNAEPPTGKASQPSSPTISIS